MNKKYKVCNLHKIFKMNKKYKVCNLDKLELYNSVTTESYEIIP